MGDTQLAPNLEAVMEVIKAQAVAADVLVLSLDYPIHKAVEVQLALSGVADEVEAREQV